MGGCQNCAPFFGYPKYYVPYYNKEPKRDHNFDNHPSQGSECGFVGTAIAQRLLLIHDLKLCRLKPAKPQPQTPTARNTKAYNPKPRTSRKPTTLLVVSRE